MEVVRAGRMLRGSSWERANFGHIYSRLIALRSLETTLREQEWFRCDDHPQPVEGFLFNEQVRDSRFVFEGDETMALCRSRPLAADCHSRHCDGNAVWEVLQILRPEDFPIRIRVAPKAHRVRTC